MAKGRQCDAAYASLVSSNVSKARQRLATAEQRQRFLPFVWAGTVAAGSLALGANFFQLHGAIGGAQLSFLLDKG
jgi:hypothetical protein